MYQYQETNQRSIIACWILSLILGFGAGLISIFGFILVIIGGYKAGQKLYTARKLRHTFATTLGVLMGSLIGWITILNIEIIKFNDWYYENFIFLAVLMSFIFFIASVIGYRSGIKDSPPPKDHITKTLRKNFW